jgi:hypothetical protein
MATIHPHPTMLHNPQQVAAFQSRTGLLIVIGTDGPIAIPALHLRTQRHNTVLPSGYSGDAA